MDNVFVFCLLVSVSSSYRLCVVLELVQFGWSSLKVSSRQPLSLSILSQVNVGIHFGTILEPFDL